MNRGGRGGPLFGRGGGSAPSGRRRHYGPQNHRVDTSALIVDLHLPPPPPIELSSYSHSSGSTDHHTARRMCSSSHNPDQRRLLVPTSATTRL